MIGKVLRRELREEELRKSRQAGAGPVGAAQPVVAEPGS
jgi:hypothetical protein